MNALLYKQLSLPADRPKEKKRTYYEHNLENVKRERSAAKQIQSEIAQANFGQLLHRFGVSF